MAKTRTEVVAMAHRRLGVLSADEPLTADQYAFGGDLLDGLISEIGATQTLTLTWDGDTVPDTLYLPVAYLLAADIAAHYDVAPRDGRSRLIAQIRSVELPDDREIRADLDDDLTVSDSEEYVDGEAQFY
jgi:hypothetical protein